MVVDDGDESWERISPHSLTWPEVDPARHPFDPSTARDVVRAVARPVPARPRLAGWSEEWPEADRWQDAVSHALVDRYGRWACGWCWSIGEAGYDGVEWCCVLHSISSEEETLALVADSLVGWRRWLEDLAERFDRFLPLPEPSESPGDLVLAWEVAVAQLVNFTVERTHSEHAWYNYCHQVLEWFLTAAGVPEHRHQELITDAVGGRFRSWVEPSIVDVTDVAERLARGVVGWPATVLDTWPDEWPSRRSTALPASAHRPGPIERQRPDDLEAWQAARTQVNWGTASRHVSGPARTGRDAIADHAAQRPEGGAEMSAALDQVRRAAAEGGPLTFARLADWQRTVLGVPEVGYRTGTAWAKGGRECYYWHSGLPEQFEECLAEATGDELPLPSRAARVYLDVAFFHPFDDGNARAATLALYYVLAREGVVLDQAAPLLVTVRQAHDKFGAAGLAKLIELLIDATRKRMQP